MVRYRASAVVFNAVGMQRLGIVRRTLNAYSAHVIVYMSLLNRITLRKQSTPRGKELQVVYRPFVQNTGCFAFLYILKDIQFVMQWFKVEYLESHSKRSHVSLSCSHLALFCQP